jgi:hypothetical protein
VIKYRKERVIRRVELVRMREGVYRKKNWEGLD